MEIGMEHEARRARALGQRLKMTLKTASALGLSPRTVSALCTAQIGISSLGDTVTAGCGAGEALTRMSAELARLAAIAGNPA